MSLALFDPLPFLLFLRVTNFLHGFLEASSTLFWVTSDLNRSASLVIG